MSKTTNTFKSSVKVAQFLKDNNIHKKDFAQMIGVTLSYVYNLTDDRIPFSSRTTTLERIATVMGISPVEFEEYRITQDNVENKISQYIKEKIQKIGMKQIDFIKSFPKKEQLYTVDMLRGVKPLPINLNEIKLIGKILKITEDEIFNLWENRIKEILEENMMNLEGNKLFLIEVFKSAKENFNS